MSTVQIIRCDECGEIKKEVNHWFKAWTSSGVDDMGIVMFSPWIEKSIGLDLCGQECVTKVLQRWMATEKLEAA